MSTIEGVAPPQLQDPEEQFKKAVSGLRPASRSIGKLLQPLVELKRWYEMQVFRATKPDGAIIGADAVRKLDVLCELNGAFGHICSALRLLDLAAEHITDAERMAQGVVQDADGAVH